MTDILDPDYESDLTEEEHNRLALMCGHAVAPPLSPACAAVLNAFRTSHTGPGCLAAALRAAAEQRGELEIPFAVIDDWEKMKGSCASFYAAAEWGYKQALKEQRAIADELEAL